jgi:pimeloyl-ACP methyl ester carboxylesterase
VKHIRAWGPSLGGLISQTLAERNPGKIQSVMPFCGAVAGPEQAFSTAMTVLYSWKSLIAPTLKVANYGSYAEALGDLGTVLKVLGGAATTPVTPVGYPLAQSNLLAGLMGGLPTKSSVYDGITVNPIIDVLAQNPAIGPGAAPGAASAQGYSPVTAGASSAVAMLQNVGTAAALGILGRFDLEQRARLIAQIRPPSQRTATT